MNQARLLRFAGLCGIAVPILVGAAMMLAIGSAGWFSWTGSTLSDLGASYPSAYYFNSALIVAGFLLLVFGGGLYRSVPGGLLPRLGTALFLAGAVFLLLIGVFTSNAGLIHSIVSVLFFSLTLISIILIGLSELRNSERLGAIAVILGLAAITMFTLPWPGSGLALPEAASILFTMIFTFIYGARLIFAKK